MKPNETELEILTGIKIQSQEQVTVGARNMLERGVKNVIVTLGSKGCLLVTEDGEEFFRQEGQGSGYYGGGRQFYGSVCAGFERREEQPGSNTVCTKGIRHRGDKKRSSDFHTDKAEADRGKRKKEGEKEHGKRTNHY